jgi:hypothetical protein
VGTKHDFTVEWFVMEYGNPVTDYTPLHGFTDLVPRSI